MGQIDNACGEKGAVTTVRQVAQMMRARLTALKYVGELLWILSEAAWILLIPQVCIPASFLAFAFIVAAAALDFTTSRVEIWLPSALQALWLFWNFVWMLDEVCFDEPDQQTPWSLTPMFGTHEKRYMSIQEYCKNGFFLAPLLWVAAILHQLAQGHLEARNASSKSSVQELICHSGYIAMWSSTDGFWACGLFGPATLTSFATFVMIVASSHKTHGLALHVDRSDVVWMLWTLSNYMWIAMELVFKDWLLLRYMATTICLQSLALLALSWKQFQQREGHQADMCEATTEQWKDELAVSLKKNDSLICPA